MEDALKRLDKLTHEEAQMAAAQILKVTHSVNDRVKIVDDNVAVVGNKMKDIGDKVDTVINGTPSTSTTHGPLPQAECNTLVRREGGEDGHPANS